MVGLNPIAWSSLDPFAVFTTVTDGRPRSALVSASTGTDTDDLAGLVESARSGDREAFSALYRRFAPVVHAVLVSRAPAQEAEDLMQDVFLAAWRGLSSLRRADHVGAWLCGIARHQAHRFHRSRRVAEPLPEMLPDPRPLQACDVDVLAVLQSLPEAYRETLAMRLVEGLTGPEIAALTGLTPGSVRVNLSRGLARLRETLRREGW
jgi:RNA polymerase sigma-70 factor (ECF subfamily)